MDCPYDNCHKVREDRMEIHLLKCQRNHKNKDFVVCPFNFAHHMPKNEYDHHTKTCTDRKIFHKSKTEQNTEPKQDKLKHFLMKNRQKPAEIDREFFPLGIRTDLDLPPDVQYSKGRGIFLKK